MGDMRSCNDNGSQYIRLGVDNSLNTSRNTIHNDDSEALLSGYSGGTSDSEPEALIEPSHTWTNFFKRGLWGGMGSENKSGYLTLIPLSDSRLKPRRTLLIIGSLLLLAVAAVATVFFTVERGVSVGTIQVRSSKISYNFSTGDYKVMLSTKIPIFNPNFFEVRISGTVNVSFYKQQAGFSVLEPVLIPAKTKHHVIHVPMNASSLPLSYTITIGTQCSTFPQQLIFFLLGELQAKYLWWNIKLLPIDNYFIVDCWDAAESGLDRGSIP